MSPTILDLSELSLREVNTALQGTNGTDETHAFVIENPQGEHALAAGLDSPADVTINGHTGYFCAGMNKHATVTINGNAGQGVAENIMSGRVHVKGDAGQSAGATGHGGLLVIDGNAGSRCGISMKSNDIVVHGNVGHLSGFMAQAGNLVICGDAGEALGDSLYEAHIYVRGRVKDLGADCIEKEMRPEHLADLQRLLDAAGFGDIKASEFKRFGSARQLYNWNAGNEY